MSNVYLRKIRITPSLEWGLATFRVCFIAGSRNFIINLCPLRDQIKRHAQTSQKHTYTLFLVPRTSTLATRILEEEGVLGEITVSSYNLQFIPLEDDVISLEYDTAFKEIWVVSLS